VQWTRVLSVFEADFCNIWAEGVHTARRWRYFAFFSGGIATTFSNNDHSKPRYQKKLAKGLVFFAFQGHPKLSPKAMISSRRYSRVLIEDSSQRSEQRQVRGKALYS
jgi:hypothetical protein